MKYYIIPFLFLLLIASNTFADGTKQLMPNCNTDEPPLAKGTCYLALGSREGGTGASRPFARYQHSTEPGKSCSDANRLYFRVKNSDETVYIGFGGYRDNGTSVSSPTANSGHTVQYRIKKSKDNGYNGSSEAEAEFDEIVKTETALPSSGQGLITSYADAYYGPKTLSFNETTKGYDPITLTPGEGLYYIEFDIGCDFDSIDGTPFDIEFFDITVATKKKLEPTKDSVINGRVYSKAWGLNANAASNQVWSTFYTFSTDHYISKVYLAGAMPYRFVFGCNSFGSINTGSAEENRQSNPKVNSFTPEYLVFLTAPDTATYGSAKLPNIPTGLTFSGDAITCEDLIFVIKLLYNESSSLELYLNAEGGEKVLLERLDAAKAKARGYHYPWKDSTELKKAGYHYYQPVAEGCPRQYKLSLFDQRYKVNGDTLNIGDKEKGTPPTSGNTTWLESLGSEKNPILIKDFADLDTLAKAISTSSTITSTDINYQYTIDSFYIASDGTPSSATFSIPGGINGFSGVHFYLTAPSNSIILDNTWPGIGTAEIPFKGVFRCGKYNPDPTTNNTNATGTQKVGDQDTIVFDGAETGLFNYCEGATIDNIHVKGNFTILEEDSETDIVPTGIGAICNYATGSTFSHCTNASKLNVYTAEGTVSIGGILGVGTNCTLDSCSNKIKISSNCDIIGGIVGTLSSGNVNFCYNVGTINPNESAGGIVGESYGTVSITNCKNEGAINCEEYAAGGILGYAAAYSNTTIEDCYNSGSISGLLHAHGIIGSQGTDVSGTLSYCYNRGVINAINTGGIAANVASLGISHSYGSTDGTYPLTISSDDIASGRFYQEAEEQGLTGTACCGKTWRNEEAGCLFKNDSLFYVTWDGKYDNGECVTGEITVDYQKNSGVTHFPFYDPENMYLNEQLKGMVVYRISPIQDSIKNDPTKYGYSYLPENYYQPTTLPTSERGIELKLYWDDRKIKKTGACETGSTGKTIEEVGYTCTRYKGGKCSYYSTTTTKYCVGIENVTEGGYLGSVKGGHTFPSSNFGDKHTINTWWNGIEAHGLSKLVLTENSPAVLMPIEIDSWIATNYTMLVLLEWSTATETNNNYFTIERSTNGLTWSTIGKVQGSGTTSITQEYTFEDTKPVDGISYYRIKQTDYNGDYSYTSIKCINRPKDKDNAFIAYDSELLNAFIVEGEHIAACPIELYSTTGTKISNVSFNTINESKVVITLENIPTGTYFIKACNTSKMVIKNW